MCLFRIMKSPDPTEGRAVEKRIRSDDGTEIFAEAIGNPLRPSIVFIHGLGLSSVVFEKLFRDSVLLTKAYLVRYDLRGHGWSGKPMDEKAHESIRYAQDFMAVMKAFQLNNPFLFGWSLGATVATDLCNQYSIAPVPLSGIIYAAALPYIDKSLMEELGKKEMDQIREGMMSSDAATAANAKIQFVRSTFLQPDTVDYHTIMSWVGSTAYITGNGIKRAVTRPQDPRGLQNAGEAGLPLLILYSQEDAQLDNEVVVKKVGPFFKDKKTVVIPRSGHAMFYDNQKDVVDEVISFIEEKTAR